MSESPYQLPEIYDIAFDFRDMTKAVDFLQSAAARTGQTEITSMVELGCGPGQYCREFARRGIPSFGIDLSPEMADYAARLCRDENIPCKIITADMRDYALPHPVDFACCMMATPHLLLTNDDMVAHLRAVAANLTDRGLYIMEFSHPRDTFDSGMSAQNKWTMTRDYVTVETDWASDAIIDPLTEINTGTITFTVRTPTGTNTHQFRERWREIPAGLITALAALSGRFEIVDWYGDLDLNQPFDCGKKAWRMITVLRKTT
jgi:SAM-dependent methyltransferase